MDELIEALNAIDCSQLTYQEWVNVGMALKSEGYSCEVWDRWSGSDARYHSGECAKKWETFNGTDEDVTAGTIYHYAESFGWRRKPYGGGTFNWDDEFEAFAGKLTVESSDWAEAPKKTVNKPLTFNEQCEQLKEYLNALFREDEHIGFVTFETSQREDKKWTPCGAGVYGLTCGEIIGKINKAQRNKAGTLDSAIGSTVKEAGAWIRFNPLDGNGVADANITAYRYALVESDELEPAEQERIIRELNLPCAALVDSGNKSIHAIVHIDALDKAEYKKRVETLYEICERNGLSIDRQNKNPSRLSRMPGIQRGENWQRLIGTNIGAASWDSWKEWVAEQTDDLPEPESLADVFYNPPELAPELIKGVLRQGHKLLLAADSKSGKSFAMIELAIALAEGKKWLGLYECIPSTVLYVNLEIDRPDFYNRVISVYQHFGYPPDHIANIHIMNLRGKADVIDNLVPGLVRRAKKLNANVVIIDPIYKILSGDENSAADMGKFCNNFDKLANLSGCSVIYAHHHSKGEQGFKSAQDRMSGSGVFARDPDAVIDLLKLTVTDAMREQAGVSHNAEGLRAEFVLRDFASPKPMNLWFDYPTHFADESEVLDGAPSTMQEAAQHGQDERKKASRAKELEILTSAFNWVEATSGDVTVTKLTNRINDQLQVDYSSKAIQAWVDKSTQFERKDGKVIRV